MREAILGIEEPEIACDPLVCANVSHFVPYVSEIVP